MSMLNNRFIKVHSFDITKRAYLKQDCPVGVLSPLLLSIVVKQLNKKGMFFTEYAEDINALWHCRKALVGTNWGLLPEVMDI